MKKALFAVLAVVAVSGCTSVESATVSSKEIAGHGDAVAVVQASALGLTAVLHLVPLVQADLDTVVNKMLVSEAKAMGASKVDLKSAGTTPRHGLFMLITCPGILLCMPMAEATGVAVK